MNETERRDVELAKKKADEFCLWVALNPKDIPKGTPEHAALMKRVLTILKLVPKEP